MYDAMDIYIAVGKGYQMTRFSIYCRPQCSISIDSFHEHTVRAAVLGSPLVKAIIVVTIIAIDRQLAQYFCGQQWLSIDP